VKKKHYPLEFKDRACDLVIKQGYSAAKASRELGIADQTLGFWLKKRGHQATIEHQADEPGDDPVVLQGRVKELLAKVRRLEMEKEILKKATAFFANQPT
jgi:transposase